VLGEPHRGHAAELRSAVGVGEPQVPQLDVARGQLGERGSVAGGDGSDQPVLEVRDLVDQQFRAGSARRGDRRP